MDLKIGDIVKLRSGGPNMTIDNIGKISLDNTLETIVNYSSNIHAKCIWFDGNSMQEGIFDLSILNKILKFEDYK